MTFYTSIFKESWKVTKRNRVLWLFGFFGLFFGGKGIDFELFFSNANALYGSLTPFQPDFWNVETWRAVYEQWGVSASTATALIVITTSLCIMMIAVSILAQIGLIDAFARPQSEQKTPYSLHGSLRKGHLYFWNVLWISIVSKVLNLALIALASSPLFFAQLLGMRLVYALVLFFIITPLTIAVSLLTKYALIATVVEQKPFANAIARSWELFSNNVGVSVELGFLMFFGFFAVNLVAIFAAVVATLPILMLMLGIAIITAVPSVLLLYGAVLYACILVFMIASAIIFSAWHYGNWTLLFLQLTKGRQRSKIHRVFGGA